MGKIRIEASIEDISMEVISAAEISNRLQSILKSFTQV
jgi:hypothetical protein